jgi:hypothetical protein
MYATASPRLLLHQLTRYIHKKTRQPRPPPRGKQTTALPQCRTLPHTTALPSTAAHCRAHTATPSRSRCGTLPCTVAHCRALLHCHTLPHCCTLLHCLSLPRALPHILLHCRRIPHCSRLPYCRTRKPGSRDFVYQEW